MTYSVLFLIVTFFFLCQSSQGQFHEKSLGKKYNSALKIVCPGRGLLCMRYGVNFSQSVHNIFIVTTPLRKIRISLTEAHKY